MKTSKNSPLYGYQMEPFTIGMDQVRGRTSDEILRQVYARFGDEPIALNEMDPVTFWRTVGFLVAAANAAARRHAREQREAEEGGE